MNLHFTYSRVSFLTVFISHDFVFGECTNELYDWNIAHGIQIKQMLHCFPFSLFFCFVSLRWLGGVNRKSYYSANLTAYSLLKSIDSSFEQSDGMNGMRSC